VFDKPNDNTPYKTSSLVPITVFDDRAGRDARLARAPSHSNLITLLQGLGLLALDTTSLSSAPVFITNAVKCDVSAETGKTGRISIPGWQVGNCVQKFLQRELALVAPWAVVFFGKNAQQYAMGTVTGLWEIRKSRVGERFYSTMRVPHTSPQAFNTHGRGGNAYVEPFKELLRRAAAGRALE